MPDDIVLTFRDQRYYDITRAPEGVREVSFGGRRERGNVNGPNRRFVAGTLRADGTVQLLRVLPLREKVFIRINVSQICHTF